MTNTKEQAIRTEGQLEGVTLLGNQNTQYFNHYNPDVLETFENKNPDSDYWVKFNSPEFTSLCPKTGQPDFATIYIQYIPNEKMVESKSLKLYLFSFRGGNEGAGGHFHEDVICMIGKDLVELMQPKYLQVIGKFTPRGGISIDPAYFYAEPGTEYEEMKKHRFMNYDMVPETITNR